MKEIEGLKLDLDRAQRKQNQASDGPLQKVGFPECPLPSPPRPLHQLVEDEDQVLAFPFMVALSVCFSPETKEACLSSHSVSQLSPCHKEDKPVIILSVRRSVIFHYEGCSLLFLVSFDQLIHSALLHSSCIDSSIGATGVHFYRDPVLFLLRVPFFGVTRCTVTLT